MLAEVFPRLVRLEENVVASIGEKGSWRDNSWVWEWRWRCAPRGREVGELEGLERRLQGWKPKKDSKDRWDWGLDTGNGYSVKKCRDDSGR